MPRSTKPKKPTVPVRRPLPPQVRRALTRPAPRRPPVQRSGFRG